MATLLVRLAGPMQSWGVASRFSDRDTLNEPSKSGVIGLLCAALGRPREQPVDDLAALRMGVRVDREGLVRSDYQTTWTERQAILSRRHYLADADFLVGLEGPDVELLARLHAAVESPHWQIFLGRKGYVPSLLVAVSDGLLADVPLVEALRTYPWPGPLAVRPRQTPRSLRLVLEHQDATSGEVRQDQPLGAAYLTRRFSARVVRTSLVPTPGVSDEPGDWLGLEG